MIFSNEQLAKIVTETLPKDAEPGEKVLVADVNNEGVKVIAAFKFKQVGFKPAWELQAVAEHDWSGDNKVGGKVVMRWK